MAPTQRTSCPSITCALEITSTSDWMMVLLEDSDFTYCTMSTDEFCLLYVVAQHIDIDRFRKTTRDPKNPVKEPRLTKSRLHVSVAVRRESLSLGARSGLNLITEH